MSFVLTSRADLRAATAEARRLADALDRLAADAAGQPSAADLADAPVLDAWLVTRCDVPALFGTVSRHPTIVDNRLTITSPMFAIDPDGRWARTWSRYYLLADAMPGNAGRRQ